MDASTSVAATTQIAGIRSYLESGRDLTPAIALTNFSCFRLAARIKELKDRFGLPIETNIKVNPVSGNRYASYSLVQPIEASYE
jgi:hypothetical protein